MKCLHFILLCIGISGANAQTSGQGRNVMVTMYDPIDPILAEISARIFPNREARLQAMYLALRAATSAWHAPVIAALRPHNVVLESYWINNQIYVQNANPQVVSLLRSLPIVRSVEDEIIVPMLQVFNPAIGRAPNGPEWGVRKIRADQVWNTTTRGQGSIVAVIDTGVRSTHTSLRTNFVGLNNNGWFDPIRRTSRPTDNVGHGTHCTGSICGNNGIGVAPAAQWMACRGCDTGGCPQAALVACGQFVVCPTDVQGRNANCSKAPHVVSNSWGSSTGGATWYNDVIKAWNTAGIIPFFAIGNDGPQCGTAGSPGDQQGVISVGATNITDRVASFSSRGPKRVADGDVAPLIVAPGENINSAHYLSDNGYQLMSGTSMATPHAAGAAALLLSYNRTITLQRIMNLLYPTTMRNLGETGYTCANIPENVYPNNVAGNGQIDVEAAIARLKA